MTTYVALLRAVNVSGQNLIKMAELKQLFDGMGLKHVQTYIQSGNVLFQAAVEAVELTAQIEAAVQARFGLTVTVILRTASELEAVVDCCPFPEAENLYVAYLAAEPEAAGIERLQAFKLDGEEWQAVGREVYIIYHNGAGRAKLTNAVMEKRLGVASTARNWRTTQRLVEMARSLT